MTTPVTAPQPEVTIGAVAIHADDLVSISGLEMPDLRVTDSNKPLEDGTYLGSDFLSGRTITVEFEVIGQNMDAFKTRNHEINQAMVPRKYVQFTWVNPEGVKQTATVRIRRRSVSYDRSYYLGYAKWVVEMRSADPRLYNTIVTDARAYLKVDSSSGAVGTAGDTVVGI